MRDSRQVYDLLLPLMPAINRIITVDEITDNLDGTFRLDTCNTLWATPGYTITIGGNDYLIEDIMPDEWIKVSGTEPIVDTSFILYEFYFVHGKLLPTSNEIGREENTFNKFPMLWLHDITNETFDRSPLNNLGRTADCDLYALIGANVERLQANLDHDRYAIRPMRNLLNSFLNALIGSNITLMNKGDNASNYQHQMRDDARFGNYFNTSNNSQNTAKFFGDDTSGTHLRINIPFKKDECCPDDCCPEPAFGGVIIRVGGVFQEVAPSNTEFDFTSGSFTYDLFVGGVDTGQDILVDGTDITVNLN